MTLCWINQHHECLVTADFVSTGLMAESDLAVEMTFAGRSGSPDAAGSVRGHSGDRIADNAVALDSRIDDAGQAAVKRRIGHRDERRVLLLTAWQL